MFDFFTYKLSVLTDGLLEIEAKVYVLILEDDENYKKKLEFICIKWTNHDLIKILIFNVQYFNSANFSV